MTFDEMVARLEETFAAQRQFIADASHELRTPLTAIAGSLDVLLLGPEGAPQTTHRMLSGMRREVQRLTRLVTDLLTLTRLDAHHGLNRQTIDLAALAREVAEEMKPVAGGRVIQVETAEDTRVQGDPDRLKQVLLNLVVNAVRFTDAESGVIRLGVYSLERDVLLTVSDNGSGIPLEAQAHLFERFYRVDKARARASFDPADLQQIPRSICRSARRRDRACEKRAGTRERVHSSNSARRWRRSEASMIIVKLPLHDRRSASPTASFKSNPAIREKKSSVRPRQMAYAFLTNSK